MDLKKSGGVPRPSLDLRGRIGLPFLHFTCPSPYRLGLVKTPPNIFISESSCYEVGQGLYDDGKGSSGPPDNNCTSRKFSFANLRRLSSSVRLFTLLIFLFRLRSLNILFSSFFRNDFTNGKPNEAFLLRVPVCLYLSVFIKSISAEPLIILFIRA